MKASVANLPPADGKPGSSSQLVPYVDRQGRYGYAKRDGTIAIAPRFTAARLFYEGLAAVCDGEDWGYIRENGEWQVRARYRAVTDFMNGNAQAFHLKEPWLGPIMHLVLKQGELTSITLDRSGEELSRFVSRENNLPPYWMPDDPFGQRYQMPYEHTSPYEEFRGEQGLVGVRDKATKKVVVEARYTLMQLLFDADGSGVKFIAMRDDSKAQTGAMSVFDTHGKLLASDLWQVERFASEDRFLASAGGNSFLAVFDGTTGRRLTPHIATSQIVFRDGVGEGFIADVGPVFFGRDGRIYADMDLVRERHQRIGRDPY